jgi:putative membrane protein
MSAEPTLVAGAPADVTDPPQTLQRRAWIAAHALNWRLALVRLLASGVAVVVTVLVVPGLGFGDWHPGLLLAVVVVFGLLNAVVKPALQFLTLRWIVASYGLVVVLVNTAMLFLLEQLLDGAVVSAKFWPLLVGGVVVGVLGLVLETAAGASPPILDRARPSDRKGTA